MKLSLEKRWREGGREGGRCPREQEDTHHSAICAAEKHKDEPRNACLCVCVSYMHGSIYQRGLLVMCGCVCYIVDGNLPARNVIQISGNSN